MGVTVLDFAVKLQKVRTECIFFDFERGLGRVSKYNVCQRGKKVLKNPFLQNLRRDITFRAQCDKVIKHKLNIHYRGSP